MIADAAQSGSVSLPRTSVMGRRELSIDASLHQHTPSPASGQAALRMVSRRLRSASVLTAVGGRIAPVITTGLADFTVLPPTGQAAMVQCPVGCTSVAHHSEEEIL